MGKKKRRRSNSVQNGTSRWALVGLAAVAVISLALVVGAISTAQSGQPEPPTAAEELAAMQQSAADQEADSAKNAELRKPAVVRPGDRPLGVVFAGDSLTYGLFASTEAAGFRPQVVAALEAGGPVEWSRGGQTGNTIATVADSIVFPETTDLIVLELGTNDVYATPVDEIPAMYDGLMAKARLAAPNAVVLCLGVWSNVDGRRGYDPLIQDACEAQGGIFISLDEVSDAEGVRGPAGLPAFGGTSDDFHPNDVGYKAIADLVLSTFRIA